MLDEQVKQQLEKELNIEHLPEDQRQQIVSQLADILLERITTAAVALLSEEQYESLKSVIDTGDINAIAEKITQFVPDLPKIAEEIVKDGIQEYKELALQSGTQQDVEQSMANSSGLMNQDDGTSSQKDETSLQAGFTDVQSHVADVNFSADYNVDTQTQQQNFYESNMLSQESLNKSADMVEFEHDLQEEKSGQVAQNIQNQPAPNQEYNNPVEAANLAAQMPPQTLGGNNIPEEENFVVDENGNASPMA